MTEKAKSDGSAPDMQKTLGQLISGVYLIGILVLGTYALFFLRAGISGDPGDWGTLGDYFGGLMNPVVSFATLVVAFAVWKQQKVELHETRKALTDQATSAELNRQEQRFFDLLNIYHRTVDSLTYSFSTSGDQAQRVQCKGKEAIRYWLQNFGSHGGNFSRFFKFGFTENSSVRDMNELKDKWDADDVSIFLDHYFRSIFRIVADSELLLKEHRHRYIKLLRAQLNRDEICLLGLNLWLDDEGKKMVPLAVEYGLLKHLPRGPLRAKLEVSLPPGVFGRRFALTSAVKQSNGGAPC